MHAGLIILRVASERRDAQNDENGAGAEQLCRSISDSVAAAAPSQQHYNLALKWSSHRRVPPQGAASCSQQQQLRRSSISFVAAAGDGSGLAIRAVEGRGFFF